MVKNKHYDLRERNPNIVYRTSSSDSEYDFNSSNGDHEYANSQNIQNLNEERGKEIQATSSSKPLIRTVLSWLIDLEIIRFDALVHYMDENCKKIALHGKIRRNGIWCSCCGMVVEISEFAIHAGSKTTRIYENVFLVEKNVSLLSCQIEGLRKDPVGVYKSVFNLIRTLDNVEDANDDVCILCADGGCLICCDGCPSAFHLECMHMQSNPVGKWFCPYCVCKICELHENEDDLFRCLQCSKKYHWDCSYAFDLNFPSTFCGHTCLEIYENLDKLLGKRNKLGEAFTWTLLRKKEPSSNPCLDDEYKTTQCNSKLTLAWKLLDGEFKSFFDRHTKINILQNVIFNHGSNSFHTVVLEEGDQVMAAACIRIHGRKLAEMPCIATDAKHIKKGMCRKLLSAIESVLCNFKVENLVIPVDTAANMWIEKLGFSHVDESMKKVLTRYNTLIFPLPSIRLQKKIFKRVAESD